MNMLPALLGVTSILLVLLPNTLLAHNHQPNNNPHKTQSASSIVNTLATALGGLDKILAFDGIEFNAIGNQFEPELSGLTILPMHF